MPTSNETVIEAMYGPEMVALAELVEAIEAWLARRGTPNE